MKIRGLLMKIVMVFAFLNLTEPGYALSEEVYRKEADAFLANMPKNLQKLQAEAIRSAIAGNGIDLERVRNSRNIPAELPMGVTRTELNGNMALFRSDKYENDTIPLLVYFHGGGWTIGSINSCSRFCVAMAMRGIAVLAVDYRLAPEHRYPAGLNDCIASVKIAADSLESWNCSGISLGGDSSGGNLAIATSLNFPEGTFDSLVAFYPVTKAYFDGSRSWSEYESGFGLDGLLMEAFNEAYTSQIHDSAVSPADASDEELLKLPPMKIVAAERDILKDQGFEFANRVKNLGKDVEYEMIPGAVHLFITVPGQSASFNRSVLSASDFIKAHMRTYSAKK